LVLPFWYRLTQVVLEKRPLNGCSVVVIGNLLENLPLKKKLKSVKNSKNYGDDFDVGFWPTQ